MQPVFHYLALGDSYTIGEQVPAQDNFPNQVAGLLRKQWPGFTDPRIIARTGWTTDELSEGIQAAEAEQPFQKKYDLVTLLIGVNNQYRGRPVDVYQRELEELVKRAIGFAGGDTGRVVILSIPDWGVTPFAEGRDRAQIAREIDAYNVINRAMAEQYHIYYIDVTAWTREAVGDPGLLAADGLHPSGREYHRWAKRVAGFFAEKHN